MSSNTRMVTTVTVDLHETLKQAARDKSNTVSGITRLALYEWLKKEGYKVDNWHVEWGAAAGSEK